MAPRVRFPAECLDDIFDHMSSKELLNCTLVSPGWNDFIGSRRKYMRRIHLKGIDRKYKKTLVNIKRILLNSNRKYEHLKLEVDYSKGIKKLLLAKGRKWTDVVNYSLKFKKFSQYLEFLRIIEPSVEKLVLQYGEVKGSKAHCDTSDLQFPNLKSLTVFGEMTSLYDKVFANSQNLESLTIKLNTRTRLSAIEAIRSSLKKNVRLKKLTLWGDLFLFNADFSSEIGFKLKDCNIHFKDDKRYTFQNVNSFLMTQKDCLETITIGQWMGDEVMRTIVSMPCLKKFVLRNLLGDSFECTSEFFPKNHSVLSLDLQTLGFNDQVTEFFLKVFPRAESLKIDYLTDQIADLVATHCRSLKYLSVRYFEVKNVRNEEFYLALPRIDCYQVSKESLLLYNKFNIQKIALVPFFDF